MEPRGVGSLRCETVALCRRLKMVGLGKSAWTDSPSVVTRVSLRQSVALVRTAGRGRRATTGSANARFLAAGTARAQGKTNVAMTPSARTTNGVPGTIAAAGAGSVQMAVAERRANAVRTRIAESARCATPPEPAVVSKNAMGHVSVERRAVALPTAGKAASAMTASAATMRWSAAQTQHVPAAQCA